MPRIGAAVPFSCKLHMYAIHAHRVQQNQDLLQLGALQAPENGTSEALHAKHQSKGIHSSVTLGTEAHHSVQQGGSCADSAVCQVLQEGGRALDAGDHQILQRGVCGSYDVCRGAGERLVEQRCEHKPQLKSLSLALPGPLGGGGSGGMATAVGLRGENPRPTTKAMHVLKAAQASLHPKIEEASGAGYAQCVWSCVPKGN